MISQGRRRILASCGACALVVLLLAQAPGLRAQTWAGDGTHARATQAGSAARWRAATDQELARLIPDRAPVLAERIETELRTASGVTDGKGRYIAAVVLITAGYSANGKYSDYLLTQAPLTIGGALLPEGRYLLGWTRGDDDLRVTISDASSGKPVLEAVARRSTAIRGVQSIHIWPPSDHSVIQLGRFAIPYSIR